MDDRFSTELRTGEPIRWITDKERMAQFAVAVVMVLVGLVVFLQGMTHGTAATIGGTVVASLLAVGAVVLAQDRKQP